MGTQWRSCPETRPLGTVWKQMSLERNLIFDLGTTAHPRATDTVFIGLSFITVMKNSDLLVELTCTKIGACHVYRMQVISISQSAKVTRKPERAGAVGCHRQCAPMWTGPLKT